MNMLNKQNNLLVNLIYEKWNPEKIYGLYGGIILSETNPNIALVNLYDRDVCRSYGCMVEMIDGTLNIIARYDDLFRGDYMKKQIDDFIELRRNNGEMCLISGKDLLTIGKTRIFDFIDNGVQRYYKYAYRYYRKENKTYVWNNVGELMYEIPFKVGQFIISRNIAIVESPEDEEYYQLYSLKRNALIESEPIDIVNVKCVTNLPKYWKEDGTLDDNYFAFLGKTRSILVFSEETHKLVFEIKDEEEYESYHPVGGISSSNMNSIFIVKKDGKFNLQYNNHLISETWFNSYKIYDDEGYEEDDEMFGNPYTIKCIVDEDDYDYLDLYPNNKKNKGKIYAWRYENFN